MGIWRPALHAVITLVKTSLFLSILYHLFAQYNDIFLINFNVDPRFDVQETVSCVWSRKETSLYVKVALFYDFGVSLLWNSYGSFKPEKNLICTQ